MAKINFEWIKAAGIRAIKTFAQVMISMITVGAAFEELTWPRIFSVAGVAAVLSLLTSLAGLPETGSDGQLVVNTTDPTKDVYKLELNDQLEALADKARVCLTVKK